MLLKFTYYAQCYAQGQEFFVRLFMVSIYKQFTTYIHVTESCIKTVLLECINEYRYIITVTVLLEHNDRSLLFPTNA